VGFAAGEGDGIAGGEFLAVVGERLKHVMTCHLE
jgi:hypothetical protein